MTMHRPAVIAALGAGLLLGGWTAASGGAEPAPAPVAPSMPDPMDVLGRIEIEAMEPIGPDPFFAPPEVPREKAAFLGVATEPPGETLRQQLKLPRGVGLTVTFVDPEGPAKAAGLKEHDVLVKLNDQWLINNHQMSVLVRMHKPGTEVGLTLIREGKEQTVKAKLSEKELPPLPEAPVMDLRDVIRMGPGMPGMRVITIPGPGGAGPGHPATRPGEAIFRWDLGPIDPPEAPGAPGTPGTPGTPGGPKSITSGTTVRLGDSAAGGVVIGAGTAEMTIDDGKQVIQWSMRDGKQSLLVKDAAGKQVFAGAIDTPEQYRAIPDDIRRKLESMNLRMRVASGPEAGGAEAGGKSPAPEPCPAPPMN